MISEKQIWEKRDREAKKFERDIFDEKTEIISCAFEKARLCIEGKATGGYSIDGYNPRIITTCRAWKDGECCRLR